MPITLRSILILFSHIRLYINIMIMEEYLCNSSDFVNLLSIQIQQLQHTLQHIHFQLNNETDLEGFYPASREQLGCLRRSD